MEKSGKSKREAKDEKQKDQKLEEQVSKSLEDATTMDDKLQLLVAKYVESERTNRRLRTEQKAMEKQLDSVLREKENLQRDYNKSVLMRDKLQEVCREQQKLIKSVKNESMQKIREEEECRKESQLKFQASLNEITQSLAKNNDENLKLRDHNIEMTKKLQQLAEHYQMREKQLEKLNEQFSIESQLYQAKLSKAEVQAAMEKEILLKEKHVALEKTIQAQQLIQELSEREVALKEQLNLYTTKYDVFQSSLQKSNDIFITYKAELDKMSKNTKKLEKEALEWKRKFEKSNATLIGLATEKSERDEHSARCTKQVEQLQKLLRALQAERTHLYKVLRENNIECPAMPVLPPEPEPLKPVVVAKSSTVDNEKMEVMTRNCAELKQTLAHLQDQMKYLNLKDAESAEASSTPKEEEGPKKRQKKRNPKNKRTAKCVLEEDALTTSTSSANTATNCATKNENQPEAGAIVKTETNNLAANEAETVEVDSAPTTPPVVQTDTTPEPEPEPVQVAVPEVSSAAKVGLMEPVPLEQQPPVVESEIVRPLPVVDANSSTDVTAAATIEPVPVSIV